MIYSLYFQVIVRYWINDEKVDQVVGLGAKFGADLPQEKEHATKLPAKNPNPSDCCSTLSEKVPSLFQFFVIQLIWLYCM